MKVKDFAISKPNRTFDHNIVCTRTKQRSNGTLERPSETSDAVAQLLRVDAMSSQREKTRAHTKMQRHLYCR